jgi:hypothetical protein
LFCHRENWKADEHSLLYNILQLALSSPCCRKYLPSQCFLNVNGHINLQLRYVQVWRSCGGAESDSVCLRWDLKLYTSNKFPGEASGYFLQEKQSCDSVHGAVL